MARRIVLFLNIGINSFGIGISIGTKVNPGPYLIWHRGFAIAVYLGTTLLEKTPFLYTAKKFHYL